MVRLHVNVDHVATLRQARGTPYPSPVEAAKLCEGAGARGITVHLREDRRHIQDADVSQLRESVTTLLNLEMAAADPMVAVALRVKPDMVTLVPEKREERTTEGGLDVAGDVERLRAVVATLAARGIPTSMFVDPSEKQLEASLAAGAKVVELHTGDYANADLARSPTRETELARLASASRAAAAAGLRVAAGHGLTRDNVGRLLAALPEVEELNVGHALVCDAVYVGMACAVRDFLEAMKR